MGRSRRTDRTTAATRRAKPPRRERLITAAIAVIARDGVRAATHRAIATEAGIPLAATTYYFTSKKQLVRAAFEHLAEQGIADLDAGTRQLPPKMSPDLAAAVLASAVTEELVDRRDQVRAEFELHLEAGRDPSLRDLHKRWVQASIDFFAAALAAAGSSDPALDGAVALAAVSGIQLGDLADPEPHLEREILGPMLRRLIPGLLSAPKHVKPA